MDRLAVSIKETTEILGIGKTHLYAMIRDGRIETFKLGRRTLVKTNSLRQMIDSAS